MDVMVNAFFFEFISNEFIEPDIYYFYHRTRPVG
jgi:hypothetical protein